MNKKATTSAAIVRHWIIVTCTFLWISCFALCIETTDESIIKTDQVCTLSKLKSKWARRFMMSGAGRYNEVRKKSVANCWSLNVVQVTRKSISVNEENRQYTIFYWKLFYIPIFLYSNWFTFKLDIIIF